MVELECSKLSGQRVELGVTDLRIIERVVALVVMSNLFAQFVNTLLRGSLTISHENCSVLERNPSD